MNEASVFTRELRRCQHVNGGEGSHFREVPMSSATKVTSRPSGNKPWVATFTFLDAGCAMDSRQLEGILASLVRLWRCTFGRLR